MNRSHYPFHDHPRDVAAEQRMAAYLAKRDAERAAAKRRNRTARILVIVLPALVMLATFYGMTQPEEPTTWNLVQSHAGTDYIISHGMTLGDCFDRMTTRALSCVKGN